ncbi:MAG: hypothetical protein ACR2HJ_09865 [Fimbriimonadales bacterium]
MLANGERQRIDEARQLESSVLEHALNVRAFVQSGDDKFRRGAEANAADVDQHLAKYLRLARERRHRDYGVEFAAPWAPFRQRTRSILSDNAAPTSEQWTSFADGRIALEEFLRVRLQAEATAALDAHKENAQAGIATISVGWRCCWLEA